VTCKVQEGTPVTFYTRDIGVHRALGILGGGGEDPGMAVHKSSPGFP
jgi:hypothetical protein